MYPETYVIKSKIFQPGFPLFHPRHVLVGQSRPVRKSCGKTGGGGLGSGGKAVFFRQIPNVLLCHACPGKRAFNVQLPQGADAGAVHMKVVLVGSLYNGADAEGSGFFQHFYKQMLLAQIAAVCGIVQDSGLQQLVHSDYDVKGADFLTYFPGGGNLSCRVEPGLHGNGIYFFAAYPGKAACDFQKQAAVHAAGKSDGNIVFGKLSHYL